MALKRTDLRCEGAPRLVLRGRYKPVRLTAIGGTHRVVATKAG